MCCTHVWSFAPFLRTHTEESRVMHWGDFAPYKVYKMYVTPYKIAWVLISAHAIIHEACAVLSHEAMLSSYPDVGIVGASWELEQCGNCFLHCSYEPLGRRTALANLRLREHSVGKPQRFQAFGWFNKWTLETFDFFAGPSAPITATAAVAGSRSRP